MLENPCVKPLECGQWLCIKPSAGLIWAAPSGVRYAAAAAAAASTVRQAHWHRQQLQRDDATLPHY